MMKDDTKNKSLNRKKNVDSKSPDMSEFVNPYWISYLISSYGRTRRINYKEESKGCTIKRSYYDTL